MTFQQAAAPLEWVQETAPAFNDAALRVVTGPGGGTGGTTAFSSAFTARSILQANLPNVAFVGSTGAARGHSHTGGTDVQGAHAHRPSDSTNFLAEGGLSTGGGAARTMPSASHPSMGRTNTR